MADVVLHFIVFAVLVISGLKFISFVVTGESRLFPKD